MKKTFIIVITPLFCILLGCSSNKLIPKSNKFFELRERITDQGSIYEIVELKPRCAFKAEVIEKTDYILISPIDKTLSFEESLPTKVEQEKMNSTYIDLVGKKYYPELKNLGINSKSLNYYDIKFGLQALTIPLKFRKGTGDNVLNPPTVETGVSIGFAPGWKLTKNIYKQSKNYLGKNVTQVAIALGPHLGLGATDLKKSSNAPGLLSDRKSPIITYGVYVLFGFNNINIGFALGGDHLLGDGRKNWVYQGKTWSGVMVSLDLLKY